MTTPDATPEPALPKRFWRRPHVSTWVVFAVSALALTLIAVPGKELPQSSYDRHWSFGWPLEYYLDRDVDWRRPFLNPTTPPWLFADSWRLGDHGHWNVRFAAVDLLVCLAILVAVCFGWEWWRRSRGRWYQFGLKDLLLLTIVVALCLGYPVAQFAREQRLLQMETTDQLDPADNEPLVYGPSYANVTPQFLTNLIGQHEIPIFKRIEALNCDHPDQLNRLIPQLEQLTRFHELQLDNYKLIDIPAVRTANAGSQILADLSAIKAMTSLRLGGYFTDADLVGLNASASLKHLDVTDTRITDVGLRTFLRYHAEVTTTPTLRQASVSAFASLGGEVDTDAEDDGDRPEDATPNRPSTTVALKNVSKHDLHLERLLDLPHVIEFRLRDSLVTADDLENLGRCYELRTLELPEIRYRHLRNGISPPIDTTFLEQLASLRTLDLGHTQIDDQGMPALERLQALEFLDLTSTGITSAGLPPLRALPKLTELRIYWNNIHDDAFHVLRHLDSLETLYLDKSQLSAETVVELRHYLPKCRVILMP